MELQVDTAMLEGLRAYRQGDARCTNPYACSERSRLQAISQMAWELGWIRAQMAFKLAQANGARNESVRCRERFSVAGRRYGELQDIPPAPCPALARSGALVRSAGLPAANDGA